jgi:hypothetical protein
MLLFLHSSIFASAIYCHWRDKDGKLLKVEEQPVDEKGNPIDLKPSK